MRESLVSTIDIRGHPSCLHLRASASIIVRKEEQLFSQDERRQERMVTFLTESQIERDIRSTPGAIGAGMTVHESLYLHLRRSEVDQQTNLQASNLEIIDALRLMDVLNLFYSLQSHKYLCFNEQIRKVLSNRDPVVLHGHGTLLLDQETLLSQLIDECILIDFFEKAIAKHVCYSVSAANNGFR